jgi:putative restriction endonuclease
VDLSLLTLGARYARPELPERWGYESHHAISRGVVTPRGEKLIVLFVTRIKQEALTRYNDLSGDLLFWEGQERHGTDDRVIDAEEAGDEMHLFYREVHHSPLEYKGKVILLNAERRSDGPSRFVFRLEQARRPTASTSLRFDVAGLEILVLGRWILPPSLSR